MMAVLLLEPINLKSMCPICCWVIIDKGTALISSSLFPSSLKDLNQNRQGRS